MTRVSGRYLSSRFQEAWSIQVNSHYQTARPHIYAVGDVVGDPSLASAAYDQCRFAALHLLSGTSERETREMDAINRRGRAIVCAATVLPLVSAAGDGAGPSGAIVMMEDRPRDSDGD